MEFKSANKKGITEIKTYSVEIPSKHVASVVPELKKKMQYEIK